MSKQVYTVTKEGIEYLCGLIRDIVSTPSELISDITLSTNQTMSSVKIDKIIKQCLQDANEYSNEVVNSLTHLIAEKIDFEPTLDNTTDKINTLLLYSANSDNNYTQYLRLTNELLNLGDTSLSLNEYMKEVDADTKYTLKTTTDALTTEVTNIKSDFNTHKDDTDVHMTQTEKDNIVNKDDISTTLNDTVTDEQVPSAKVVYDKLEEINTNFQDGVNTIYNSVVAKGVTPTDKSPSSIASAISGFGNIELSSEKSSSEFTVPAGVIKAFVHVLGYWESANPQSSAVLLNGESIQIYDGHSLAYCSPSILQTYIIDVKEGDVISFLHNNVSWEYHFIDYVYYN